MSNEPKCVYIKTDVGYVQITYAEFAAYETQLKITKLHTGSYRYKVFCWKFQKTPTKAFYREKERERLSKKIR